MIGLLYEFISNNISSRELIRKANWKKTDQYNKSEIPHRQPTMWNHRLIHTSLNMWHYQTLKQKNLYLETSDIYSFIFDDKEFEIEAFLYSLSFGKESNKYFVDNITLEYFGYSTNKKNYEIDFYECSLGSFKPKNNKHLMIVAKLMILIINDASPENINFKNYDNLIEFYLNQLIQLDESQYNSFGPINF